MKGIPWWVWLLAAGGGLYLLTRSGSVSTGGQVYIPAGTPLYTDAALTQSAGTTSVASVTTAGTISGNSLQIVIGGTPYYVNLSPPASLSVAAPSTATTAQISSAQAGTLT